jgi:hypothetical protein
VAAGVDLPASWVSAGGWDVLVKAEGVIGVVVVFELDRAVPGLKTGRMPVLALPTISSASPGNV